MLTPTSQTNSAITIFFFNICIQLLVSLILQHFGLHGTALRPEQPTAQAANEAVEVIQLKKI